ncbi:MAG TPA: ATP-binding protein [Terriglobia bacterium]|nr:ATP-binding protein [Terriglobia bacterium]
MKVPPQTTKLYLAGVFLLTLALLVFVQAAFNLSPFLSPSGPNQIGLLVSLSTFIFLVLLVFGFVLLRTLVKVWAERRRGKPGSKFKTKLVFTLVLLTLIPAMCLFGFAFGLVNRSIDKWFSVPVDEIFQATSEMSAFLVLDEKGEVVRSSVIPDGVPSGLPGRIVSALRDRDEALIDIDTHWVRAQRIDAPQGKQIQAAVFPKLDRIDELTSKIGAERANYNLLIQKRKSYRDTLLYILLLMTVLVLFSAVWVGLFLSKRITVPIEALSEATRELSAGDLSHRVNIEAEDELGLLVSLFNDMAEQLQGTTRELESRRRYMEIILESIPAGVISADPDFRVNKINRVARTLFSSEDASTLGQIFGEDLHFIRDLLRDAGANSVTRDIAFTTRGPAHSAVTATRLTSGEFLLVIEDLTEVVRAQKASAWREVARRLAHEIKNPLTPIQLSAERIAKNIARLPAATPRVTNVIEECVETIVEEVSSLKNLVDEFVRFARLPAVSRVPNSMKDLVDKTMALYEDRLDRVKVSVDVPDDLPPILMDSLQMKRVLVNLLDNALEALSGEPAPELRIRCELARDETMARLTIADTGCGITPDDRERLFTPYFSTRKNGTGLGLAISSRIVADHGGYIGVEPNSPRGTRFVVELPVCQESSLSMTSPASGSR